MPNALWSQNLSKAVESGLQYLLGEQARRASRGLKRILTRLFQNSAAGCKFEPASTKEW